MDATTRNVLWEQLGASIDMLENVLRACPDGVWHGKEPQFWHIAFHTLFFLDLYLSDSADGFAPPPPFTLSELEPSGILPERVYSRDELLEYLDHGRRKARARIEALTTGNSTEVCQFGWIALTRSESVLYNMRHVQHHVAQLNLLLRLAGCDVPRWVRRAAIA